MIKKAAIVICLLLTVLVLFLVTPLPYSRISHDKFISEEPTAYIPSSNEQKCRDDVLYVTRVMVGYSDAEIIDERCAGLQSELANAAIDGDLAGMRSALKRGASAQSGGFSRFSSDAYQPVIIAARHRQTEAVKLLLDNGTNVNSAYTCCMSNQSLLMVAISMNDEATVELLLARNADIGFKSQFESWDVFDEGERVGNPTILNMLYNACESTVVDRVKCRVLRLSKRFRKNPL